MEILNFEAVKLDDYLVFVEVNQKRRMFKPTQQQIGSVKWFVQKKINRQVRTKGTIVITLLQVETKTSFRTISEVTIKNYE